jgi:hypothetical protein
MKKYVILAMAAVMVMAFTLPSYALENEFGGFWDTRFESRKYFDGFDRGDAIINPDGTAGVAGDDTEEQVATRTRLYYTAKINDNLKLVNKFEMDAHWGGQGTRNGAGVGNNRSYGQTGADGVNIEIKNTYADFNVGPVNFTVGVQGFDLFRSFYISEDASGVIGRWKVMDNFVLAASWLKAYEGGSGTEENDDVDSYTITGAFWFNENISLKPSVSLAYSDDPLAYISGALYTPPGTTVVGADSDLSQWTLGADFDMAYDNWGLWVTAVMQTGSVDDVTYTTPLGTVQEDVDFKGYLLAIGGNVMLGGFDIYGEAAYGSGSDDLDEFGFSNPLGAHGWSELLADGTLWNGTVAGADQGNNGDYSQVTNLMYIGGGFKWSPMDKLTINPEIWYAKLDEDNLTGEDTLGTEVDLTVTYQLVEGMNLELIGAYLFADDAFSSNQSENEEDAYEYGMRLSLSF